MLNILSISTLFPTPDMAHHGIFVQNRLDALAKLPDTRVTVINPIPFSFVHRFFAKYDGHKYTPNNRNFGALNGIYHLKFPSLPKIAKTIEEVSLKYTLSKHIFGIDFRHGPFDVVDVHWSFPDLPAALAIAKKLNIPCIMTLRGMETFYKDDNDNRKNVIANALSQVDHIISLSHEMAEHAKNIAKVKNKISVIRNGVDIDNFFFSEKNVARATTGISLDRKVIIGVGSLIERKGFHHVIDAIALLNQNSPDNPYHYYILGASGMEGSFGSSLRKKINKLKLEDNIHFPGKIDNNMLRYWYSSADVFCLSSSGEGSPNVLTEALACGTVAVATSVGAVPDIMKSENGLGVVVDIPTDNMNAFPRDLANAIVKAEEISLSPKDRANAMQKYTWEWCAKKTRQTLLNAKLISS